MPAANVLSIPEGMDFPTAAFPLSYGTAHLALTHRARLGTVEVLLVHGGAGNVGRAAIGMSKRLGATVIATAGGPEHSEIAAEHGADRTIDYGREDVRDRVEEFTDGGGADVIFDPVGGDAFDASLRCVAWEGTILVVGFASGRIPEAPARRELLRNCAVVGRDWGGYLRREPETVRASTAEALRWYEEEALDPRASHTFLLERVADALEAQTERQVTGKVVLTSCPD